MKNKKNIDNLIINLHNNVNEYITNYILKYDYYEPLIIEILLELWKQYPHSIFVDIGANIGYHSLYAAKNNIKSYAFEPIQSNYSLLIQNIIDNNFQHLISSYQVALTDKYNILNMKIYKENMGASTLKDIHENIIEDYKEKVITIKLDDILYDINKQLILKIDVEGCELDVLNGMTNILNKNIVSHIILEIQNYNKDIFDLLKKYGYNYFTNIGFSTNKKLNYNTDYLKQFKYISYIENITNIFNNNEPNEQRQLLFYKTINPLEEFIIF